MKYLAVMLTLVLAGCGAEDSGRDATLEDLVGTWDTSEKIGQEIDELYFIVKDDGATIDFDYFGDSYDQGDNCYSKEEGSTIVDNGAGNFFAQELTAEESSIHISISGSTITITGSYEGQKYTSTAKKISLIESDFTPLCDQFF